MDINNAARLRISVAGRLSFGFLADRFSKRAIMSSAMILEVLAVFCLFRVDSFGALPVFAILFGLGLGGGAAASAGRLAQ